MRFILSYQFAPEAVYTVSPMKKRHSFFFAQKYFPFLISRFFNILSKLVLV